MLRKLYVLEHSAFPVDHVRKTLRNANRDDDRVWLETGKSGGPGPAKFDEASHWLARCEHGAGLTTCPSGRHGSRWRGRPVISLGRSGGRSSSGSAGSRRPKCSSLRAWLAARRGETELSAARSASVVSEALGTFEAWDRLAELAFMTRARRRRPKTSARRRPNSTVCDNDTRSSSIETTGPRRSLSWHSWREQLGRRIEAQGLDARSGRTCGDRTPAV